MELARLYPCWVYGLERAPQPNSLTKHPLEMLWALRGSVLHRGYLSDLWGVHRPENPGVGQRVELSWLVWGYTRGVRWLITSRVGFAVITATIIWPSAAWFEREVWEMLGIYFVGHPDLRRLLTDYGFTGWPGRKEFPVGGLLEVRYSERSKRVITRRPRYIQEFRRFDFTSPWQT